MKAIEHHLRVKVTARIPLDIRISMRCSYVECNESFKLGLISVVNSYKQLTAAPRQWRRLIATGAFWWSSNISAQSRVMIIYAFASHCAFIKILNEIETVANVDQLMSIKLFLSYMITSLTLSLCWARARVCSKGLHHPSLDQLSHVPEIIRTTSEAPRCLGVRLNMV